MGIFVGLSIIFMPIIFVFIWHDKLSNHSRKNSSKILLNSIHPKKDEDKLDEMLKFIKANPKIKYDINAWRK